MNWTLHQPGDLTKWDGLTSDFIRIVEDNPVLLQDALIKKWYGLSKRMLTTTNVSVPMDSDVKPERPNKETTTAMLEVMKVHYVLQSATKC